MLLQIAGRAGRASSQYGAGEVTTLHPADLNLLHEGLAAPPEEVLAAGLFPEPEQLIEFAAGLEEPGLPFSEVSARPCRLY
jgi:hypothetical protein